MPAEERSAWTARLGLAALRLLRPLAGLPGERHQAGAELAGILEHEFDTATQVHDDRNRGLWRHRLPESFARLASPLL